MIQMSLLLQARLCHFTTRSRIENQSLRNMFIQSVTQATRKKIRVLPTGVERLVTRRS